MQITLSTTVPLFIFEEDIVIKVKIFSKNPGSEDRVWKH